MAQWLVHWGALLGFQGAKPLFSPTVLAHAVSSLPVEPSDAVHSLKKPHEAGQVYQPTGSQGLILSKQLFNVHLFITNIEFLQLIFQYQVNALAVSQLI